MDLVSIDYNKPVASQVEIWDGAVLVLLLSISLVMLLLHYLQTLGTPVKNYNLTSGVPKNQDCFECPSEVPTFGPKRYVSDDVSDAIGNLSQRR